MNLLEAIEVIELFTFTEENDRGIECIKTKLNDEYYFHKKYLFEHDMDALIDYTWQMGNFVKVVSQTEDEIILFDAAVETIKKYRNSKELKNTIIMENVKFIEDEEDVKKTKPTKKSNKKTSKKRSITILNEETGGEANGNKT